MKDLKIGVIFDMDGVLVDSESFYLQRRLNFLQKKGLKPGSSNLLDYVGKTDQGIWEVLVPDDEALRSKLHKEYLPYREEHPIDYIEALNDDVKKILTMLKEKNIPIGLASSAATFEIEKMMRATNLSNYFDYVISGESLKESKPNPEIYLKAMAELGCETYIAVEDSPIGIKAAKASGAYTVALAQRYPLNQQEADIVIENLIQLLELPLLS